MVATMFEMHDLQLVGGDLDCTCPKMCWIVSHNEKMSQDSSDICLDEKCIYKYLRLKLTFTYKDKISYLCHFNSNCQTHGENVLSALFGTLSRIVCYFKI